MLLRVARNLRSDVTKVSSMSPFIRKRFPASADDDVFHDPVMRLVIVILVLFTLASASALAVVYWGDSYVVPAWDERSVPPPDLD
jgi:hypothetical protein